MAALEKLMASHAKGLEQRKLLVSHKSYWDGDWPCGYLLCFALADLL